jgi:hypothetical protein
VSKADLNLKIRTLKAHVIHVLFYLEKDMSKKIKQMYWSFAEKITLPEIEVEKSFLFFRWKTKFTPTEYKYANEQALLNAVNVFIADTSIDQILSFENNAKTLHYSEESYGSDVPFTWSVRTGGITIHYLVESE